MLKPFIQESPFEDGCYIKIHHENIKKPEDYNITFKDLAIANTEITTYPHRVGDSTRIIYLAIRHNNVWKADPLIVTLDDNLINIEGEKIADRSAIAFPIDPKMKPEDIDGARHIYLNDAGTAYMFAHATVEEHHDRMLLAETAIATVFDELVMERLIRSFPVVLDGTSAIVQEERSTSEQRGQLGILAHITNFKHDCMKLARYNEGQLHIGEHVKNPEKHYIYKMIENAFDLCKKKWTAEKPAELNQISDHLKKIEKRLKSRHSFKRRWEIPVVFPDAQTSTTTPTQEGS